MNEESEVKNEAGAKCGKSDQERFVMRPCPWCKSNDLSVTVGRVVLPKSDKYKGLYGHTGEVKCNKCLSIMTQQSKVKLAHNFHRSMDLSGGITREDWNNRERFLDA